MTPSDLVISFTGLCLLLPDPAGNQLHVFLLKSDARVPHVPRLYIQDGSHVQGCAAVSNAHFVDLKRTIVDLSGLGGSTGSVVIPKTVPDITAATTGTVDGAVIKPGASLPQTAVAHFALAPGVIRTVLGAKCNFGGVQQEMAVCATITLSGAGDPVGVALALTSLGIRPGDLPIVRNAIRLLVVNVPVEELPGAHHASMKVTAGEEVPHFRMYYELVTTPASKQTCPTFANDVIIPAGTSCPCEAIAHGSFIRCMVGQAGV